MDRGGLDGLIRADGINGLCCCLFIDADDIRSFADEGIFFENINADLIVHGDALIGLLQIDEEIPRLPVGIGVGDQIAVDRLLVQPCGGKILAEELKCSLLVVTCVLRSCLDGRYHDDENNEHFRG